jgi:hypothetical protein
VPLGEAYLGRIGFDEWIRAQCSCRERLATRAGRRGSPSRSLPRCIREEAAERQGGDEQRTEDAIKSVLVEFPHRPAAKMRKLMNRLDCAVPWARRSHSCWRCDSPRSRLSPRPGFQLLRAARSR